MPGTRAEAVYSLCQGFAEVLAAEGAEQKKLAQAWNQQLEGFYDTWPDETIHRVSIYISLAMMDDNDKTLPGTQKAEMLQRITAEIYAIQALATDDEADA